MTILKPLIVGIEALRNEGWTTQVPRRAALAYCGPDAPQMPDICYEFAPERRDPAWFAAAAPGVIVACDFFDYLHPAWALADMLVREGWGRCGLDETDIEWDDITLSDTGWLAACTAFGLPYRPFFDMTLFGR